MPCCSYPLGWHGDALGYAVEFLKEEQIFQRYGENGITEYSLRNGKAEISDDTQMTLFTANGLLVGTTRGMMRGIMGSYQSYIQIMYKCWYRTQTERYPITDGYKYSWLLDVPDLFSRRVSFSENGRRSSCKKVKNVFRSMA